MSQFGSLATALAATIGTGNIIGVGTAIALGGPGAVLWCWLTGVCGISTKYAEGLLAIKYRVKTKGGRMLGGPMYALERGLGWKWLAVLFAVFTALAAFGIGNTVQANAIATVAEETYHIHPALTGAVVCLLAGAVVLGGVRSIARVCGLLVPVMALFYVLGCLYILTVNAEYLWPALKLIVTSAFSPQAAGGGFVGTTVMMAARWARHPSWQLPPRRATPSVRHWFRRAAPSGIRSSSVPSPAWSSSAAYWPITTSTSPTEPR